MDSPVKTHACADAPVARLLAMHRANRARYPVLLETAARLPGQPSHSLLLAGPGERLVLRGDGRLEGPGEGGSFLSRLDQWWRAACAPPPGELPFAGGWFLLLGYELAGEVEPVLRLPRDPNAVVAVAWRMHGAACHEHASGRTTLVAEPGHEALLDAMRADLAAAGGDAAPPAGPLAAEVDEDAPGRYLEAVRAALEHIAAGDVYQANLARRWRARLATGVGAADVYARLRQANPAPFAGLADAGGFAVASSSPERLVRVRGRRIDTRPIAGTRPRGHAPDELSIRELVAHPKERAEHVMLIDLERNDLGRLCVPGSVRVDEFMTVESYAHVHHIVSNVSGELESSVTPGAVIRALFPGGTITGCPKVRCLEIIAELERRPRGVYTGSMGYLAGDGSMDLNILIRSLAIADGVADLFAGAGIVADSDPLRELEETRAKARGVLRALTESQ